MAVAAHQNGNLRPATADVVKHVAQHARDLLARRPLAGPQERENRLAGIALDIDTPEDLQQLAHAPGERHSQLLARHFGLAEAPATVNS